MEAQSITIKRAREHNLQNISLDIPKGKLICFTGVSGSGKSSLAFDRLGYTHTAADMPLDRPRSRR